MRGELGRLPAGRHNLSREQVAYSQRERLIAGLAQVVAERGFNETKLGDITKAAAVSRRVFYENFSSKEECFLAAFDIVVEDLRKVVMEAVEPYETWPDRVVAALRAVLRFFSAEPDLARLCLVEPTKAGPNVAARFRAAVLSFTPLLRLGRSESPGSRQLPGSTEDSLLGATVLILSRAIMTGETERLEEFLPDLVEFILLPYVGLDEAQRFARQPA